jgi:sigma-B regulation protein RsbU (phosphoserine phosphatase)
VTLAPGDLITLYSDGIPETQRPDDEDYGEDRFEKLLVAEHGNDLAGLFDKLQEELKSFRGDAPIGDDVTMVILRRNPA